MLLLALGMSTCCGPGRSDKYFPGSGTGYAERLVFGCDEMRVCDKRLTSHALYFASVLVRTRGMILVENRRQRKAQALE